MGIFNDMKKLIFGAKAVTKSAAEKAAEKGRQAGDELTDKTSEWMDKASEAAADTSEKLRHSTRDAVEKAKIIAEDIGGKILDASEEPLDKARAFAEEVGGKILGAGSSFLQDDEDTEDDINSSLFDEADALSKKDKPGTGTETTGKGSIVDKAKDFAENTGSKILHASEEPLKKARAATEEVGKQILDKSGDALDKAKIMAEGLGGKILDASNDFAKKAKSAIDNPEETMDSIMDKAKKFGDKLDEKIKNRDKGKWDENSPIGYDNAKKSLLDDKDDFFSKAQRYSEGDYQSFSDKNTKSPEAESDEAMKILDQQAAKTHPFEKEPFKGEMYGFEDLDGDGDPLIDDAEVEEEEVSDEEMRRRREEEEEDIEK